MATIERRPRRDKARLGAGGRHFLCVAFVLLTIVEVRCYETTASHICMKSEGSGIRK